jgi:dolichol-phosphate mannosyltransferase
MTLSPEIVTKHNSFLSPRVSLIIPVFNQQNKVSFSLEKIKQTMESILSEESTFSDYEMIVVNDGSTDNTLAILRGIASTDDHVRVLSYTPNRGKGYAVRQGVLESQGEAVMFLDGDLDISPDSIRDYVERLRSSDLVIASKRHPESDVRIPISRAFLSRAFNIFVRATTGIPQKDTQAGFKAGNGEVMRTIFRNISVKRYAFDIELFTIASVLHLKVQEMPVIMKIDRQFKMKEIVNMFMDVTRICYRHKVLHAYQKELEVHLPFKLVNDESQYQQSSLTA